MEFLQWDERIIEGQHNGSGSRIRPPLCNVPDLTNFHNSYATCFMCSLTCKLHGTEYRGSNLDFGSLRDEFRLLTFHFREFGLFDV